MSDYALMSLAPKRPGNFPQGVPDSAGIPRSVQGDVIVAPFNAPRWPRASSASTGTSWAA
jgi:hypothetical protein